MANPVLVAAALCSSREDRAAFLNPARKPPPPGDLFDSSEAAEEAGWKFNATAPWEMPAGHLARLKEVERTLKMLQLTDTRVDAMDLHDLRRAFNTIRDGPDNPPPPPGSGAPTMFEMEEDEVTLRARLKEYSRELARLVRHMRKSKSIEPLVNWKDVDPSSRTAHSVSPLTRLCKACGKEPPAVGLY
jgi:hypothetical protein